MGYFPNGTACEMYEEKYCVHCAHQRGLDGESGCAIMLAHLIHNYDECNNPDSILHLLIPKDGISNGHCQMFWPKETDK